MPPFPAPPPPVTDDLIAEVVARVRAVGDPLQVVVFGSWARGEAGPASDLDVLVIEESDEPRYKRSARYYRALAGLHPEKDVVVWTPAEVDAWRAVPNAFITTVLREGRVVYAR